MTVVFQVGDPREPVTPASANNDCVVSNETNRLMIGNEECSDAVFLIGDRRETAKRIPVITGFLSRESSTFDDIFCTSLICTEISFPDMDESAMYSLLRWIYCRELVFEPGKLDALLRLAHQFRVISLLVFVDKHAVTSDHMWAIASFARAYDQQGIDYSGLKQKCLQCIISHPEKHFGSEDIVNASAGFLTEVLAHRIENYDKMSLFKQLLRWADAECVRQELFPHAANKLKVIDPFIHLIPFSEISRSPIQISCDTIDN